MTVIQTIQVGAEATTAGGIFQYIPNTMNATNGTVITFEFSGAYVVAALTLRANDDARI